MAEVPAKDDFTVEDAAVEVKELAENAIQFINSEIMPDWEDAEDYFAGYSRVPKVKGRSQVTETVVRDAVRAIKPSITRVLLQSGAICAYAPATLSNPVVGAIADQQTTYVNQLFWACGGYNLIQDALHDALLKKVGIMKASWCEYQDQKFITLSGIDDEQLSELEKYEDVHIISVEEENNDSDEDDNPLLDTSVPSYEVELVFMRPGGKIELKGVQLYSFFIDDEATGFGEGEFTVCGEQTSMTIGDAMKLGLDYEDLIELDDEDPETSNNAGESEARRGYAKRNQIRAKKSVDPMMRKVLITEAYARYDLLGTGYPQLYRWWLGGSSRTYLAHDRVEETPYGAGEIEGIPGTFFGRSLYDILQEDQDTQTSLLRATCDNAHLANNRRLGIHETLVNVDDVLNNQVGAPIRFKQPGMIQEIGVSASVGAMLPLLQYLGTEANNKVGVTDASLGLDPDALQSTDKDAVKNTIQLSQGQVELMARNFAEGGIKTIFDKMLRLSLRHMPKEQAMEVNGSYIPVNTAIFDPAMKMKTKVGIGNAGLDHRIAALQGIIGQQKEIIAQYGVDNPIVPVEKLFNAMSDLAGMMGITNIGRYFNPIDQRMSAALAQKTSANNSKQQGGAEQAAAIVQSEQIATQGKVQIAQMDNTTKERIAAQDMRSKIIDILTANDRERDKMAQNLAIEDAKITSTSVDKRFVATEQNKARAFGELVRSAGLQSEDASGEGVQTPAA